MRKFILTVGAGCALTLAATTAGAQTQYIQCFGGYDGQRAYWSAIVTHPGGEYESRLFYETFVPAFERHLWQAYRASGHVSCLDGSSYYSVNSLRSYHQINGGVPTPVLTEWTDGRPVATGDAPAAPPRQARQQPGPPAIIVGSSSTRDSRRTPGEIAREEAQREADRQRAQEQAARAAAVQQEAQRLRERRAAEAAAADARDRANRCGRYRDPNSRSSCVSPQ